MLYVLINWGPPLMNKTMQEVMQDNEWYINTPVTTIN